MVTISLPWDTCPHCGDDVEIHEYINGESCDRA